MVDHIPDALDIMRQVLIAHDFYSLPWLLLPYWWTYSLLVRPFTTVWLAFSAFFTICFCLSLARMLIESLAMIVLRKSA